MKVHKLKPQNEVNKVELRAEMSYSSEEAPLNRGSRDLSL